MVVVLLSYFSGQNWKLFPLYIALSSIHDRSVSQVLAHTYSHSHLQGSSPVNKLEVFRKVISHVFRIRGKLQSILHQWQNKCVYRATAISTVMH